MLVLNFFSHLVSLRAVTVLVFGANVATLVAIAVVGVTKRRVKENIKVGSNSLP